ncbi:MAG: homoserine kinase [Frankiaceae bacterium]|nr:homoserine kinase [Frankiaceae bacterium]
MAGPSFRGQAVRVQVPATSANLGPGFDALGLALGLYDEIAVRVAESGLSVDVSGEAADEVRRDERHLVVSTMRKAFDALGGQPRGLEVRCLNRIPHGRGLGSSSAAIVAGIVAARALILGGEDSMDDAAALELATRIEGHPDNVAACLLGGATIAWMDGDRASATRFEPASSVTPVVFVPHTSLKTKKARRLLPESVSHADASFNAGRAALLVEALSRRTDLLFAATEDRLHQGYRAEAMPRSAALIEALRADGVAAVVSGAGPSILALPSPAAAEDLLARAPRGWRAWRLPVDLDGAQASALRL